MDCRLCLSRIPWLLTAAAAEERVQLGKPCRRLSVAAGSHRGDDRDVDGPGAADGRGAELPGAGGLPPGVGADPGRAPAAGRQAPRCARGRELSHITGLQ